MLSNEELDEISKHTVVLANILLEKVEILEENKLPAHRLKNSVKNAKLGLENYLNRIFTGVKSEKDRKIASDYILFKQERIEAILTSREVMIFEDKKGMLQDILEKHGIYKDIATKIIIDVDKSEILKF